MLFSRCSAHHAPLLLPRCCTTPADGVTQVTAWPSALTVTMSWDTAAMYAFGYAMGQEQRAKG